MTGHEYDLIQRYRDLGGNLAFLSANDFFYKVVKHGDPMDGRWRWRDLGRPEAALVGAQYVDWNHGALSEPAVHRHRRAAGAVALHRHGPSQRRDVRRLRDRGRCAHERLAARHARARAHPDIFGPGKTAEMTYYTTPRGAKVFSAGVMNFGGSALWPWSRR